MLSFPCILILFPVSFIHLKVCRKLFIVLIALWIGNLTDEIPVVAPLLWCLVPFLSVFYSLIPMKINTYMAPIVNSVILCLTRTKVPYSAVGITTGYGLDGWEVIVWVPVGARSFSSPGHPDRLWGPPFQWGLGDLSPGVKRPGNEADHSPPSSAEVKNAWIYTSNAPYVFMP
jgi:hypothetical protein